MTQVHTQPKSKNKKTGPMPVTTSEQDTCPDACPFNHNNEGGCLAEYGPLKLHWDKVSSHERGDTWEAHGDIIRQGTCREIKRI